MFKCPYHVRRKQQRTTHIIYYPKFPCFNALIMFTMPQDHSLIYKNFKKTPLKEKIVWSNEIKVHYYKVDRAISYSCLGPRHKQYFCT